MKVKIRTIFRRYECINLNDLRTRMWFILILKVGKMGLFMDAKCKLNSFSKLISQQHNFSPACCLLSSQEVTWHKTFWWILLFSQGAKVEKLAAKGSYVCTGTKQNLFSLFCGFFCQPGRDDRHPAQLIIILFYMLDTLGNH